MARRQGRRGITARCLGDTVRTDAWMARRQLCRLPLAILTARTGAPLAHENERYVLRAIWSDERGRRAVSVGSGMLMQRQESKWEPLVVDPTMLYRRGVECPIRRDICVRPGRVQRTLQWERATSVRSGHAGRADVDMGHVELRMSTWERSTTGITGRTLALYDGVNWTHTSIS
jgi:hypothetical protein